MADFLKFIEKTVANIEATLTDDISVASICRASSLSPFYLQRIFRAYTGESVGNYIRRRRLSLALEELKTTSDSVLTIALKYHFGSSEAFSRSCKAYFGFSPTQLRKSKTDATALRKPGLQARELAYLRKYAAKKPVVRRLHGFRVVGKEGRFTSPLLSPLQYMKKVDDVWKSFYPALVSQFQKNQQGHLIGVLEGVYAKQMLPGETSRYLAGCRSRKKIASLSGALSERKIPEGLYAIFEYHGYHEQTQYIINYIYSTWLPASSYLRGDGPEFTILDCRSGPPDPTTSPIQYCLPVVERKANHQ